MKPSHRDKRATCYRHSIFILRTVVTLRSSKRFQHKARNRNYATEEENALVYRYWGRRHHGQATRKGIEAKPNFPLLYEGGAGTAVAPVQREREGVRKDTHELIAHVSTNIMTQRRFSDERSIAGKSIEKRP
jgi:hypothetical protein